MTRALGVLLLFAACITGGDVQGALDGYCSSDTGKACTADADCCPSFVCLPSGCAHLTAGTCLFPDAGSVQSKGSACGSSADCVSACTCGADSKCM